MILKTKATSECEI